MVRKLKAKDLKLPVGKFAPSVRKKLRDIEIPDAVKIVLEQAVYALAGLVLSLRTFDGAYLPFGIAFAAAAPLRACLAAALGASAGYLIAGTGTQALQSIAAIAVVTVMARALAKVFHRISPRTCAVLAAGTGCAVTGAARVMIDGVTPAGVALALAQTALASGCAYLFERVTELDLKKIKTADRTSMACVVLFVCLMLMSLAEFSLYGIAPARIAAVLLILVAARAGGVSGGAVTGIAAGLAMAAGSPDAAYIVAGYTLGGLTAGICAPLKSLGCALAFTAANAVAALVAGDALPSAALLIETAVADVILILMPAGAINWIRGWTVIRDESPVQAQEDEDGLRRSLVMRLKGASSAMEDVSVCVDKVCAGLKERCAPDMTGIYSKVCDNVCFSCTMRSFCWTTAFDDTMNVFNDIGTALRAQGRATLDNAPEYFRTRCTRKEDLLATFNREYANYLESLSAQDEIGRIRSQAAEQFGTIAQMLGDLSNEYAQTRTYDDKAAYRVRTHLQAHKIPVTEADCILDKDGRMTVHVLCDPVKGVDRRMVAEEVGTAARRVFELPCVNTCGGKTLITLSERACFTAPAAGAQITCSSSAVSGDSYECFNDGCGRQLLVISDGMGTGARAAVDGAMASGLLARLIKAGFGFDCALKVVNSSLLVKSSDESLATLDIACIDLFTGRVDFLKAGAPASFIRKNGKAHKLENASLPAGILPEVAFARSSAMLGAGDIVLMASDGALEGDTEWICARLEDWQEGDARALARHIAQEAKRRVAGIHDDDITVVAAIIGK